MGLKEQVNILIENGVHGIFVCGTSGELFSLTSAERKRVNNIVVDETNSRVPVLAGTGSSIIKGTLEFTRHAIDIGADVAAIVAPYFTHANDDGLIKYFQTIATAVDIPIALYNIPGRAGINISPQVVLELSKIENIIGIKDSSANMIQFAELLRLVGDTMAVLQGEDPLILESLILGANGSVPAVANVAPKLVVGLYDDVLKNKIEEACEGDHSCS